MDSMMLVLESRAPQLGRKAQADHGEDLVEALQDALRHPGRLEVQTARKVARDSLSASSASSISQA
jgi:hypothetical protein